MKNNKMTIDELIKKLHLLEEGMYTKNSLEMKVVEEKEFPTHKDSFYVKIKKNGIKFDIYIPFINEYSINMYYPNYDLYLSKNIYQMPYVSLTLKINKDEYRLRNGYISKNNKKQYLIYNREMIKEIDENSMLAYNYDDEQVYVYYKKYNKEGKDLKKNYVKFKYDEKFIRSRNLYNEKISKIQQNLKREVVNREFIDLINTINIPKVTDNFKDEVNTLIEVANIYINNNKLLNFENSELYSEICEFIEYLLNNPTEARINSLRNLISEADLTDKKQIKNIKRKLNDIYRMKETETLIKSSKDIKKKTLLNTDIEN